MEENVIYANGFEEALIGTAMQFNNRFAVYDRDKCIEILARDMTYDEAVEYFEYNVSGAYVGPNTPAFITICEEFVDY